MEQKDKGEAKKKVYESQRGTKEETWVVNNTTGGVQVTINYSSVKQ